MKDWYNYETSFKFIGDNLRSYLKVNDIKYELSSCYCGVHYEIYASPEEKHGIDAFLNYLYERENVIYEAYERA